MGVIKFLAFSKSGQKEDCDFEVARSDPHTFLPAQTDANGDFFVSITPPAGGQAPLGVRAKPKQSKFWELEGHFSVDDKGTVRRLKSPPGSFFIRGTMQGSGNFVAVITAQLSIFRDITDQALGELLVVPAPRQGANPPAPKEESVWPPTSWHGPTINTFTSVSSRLLRPGSVTLGSKTFTRVVEGITIPYQPATTERVLERIGGTLPQRIVVAWPDGVIRNANSTPTSYLTFFTHLLNQNKAGHKPNLDVYPTSWDYLWLAIWRYLNYSGDIASSPIDAHVSRGLLEQVLPEYRRRGHATSLLRLAVARAEFDGRPCVFATVPAETTLARRLFECAGFHRAGVLADHYRPGGSEDVVVHPTSNASFAEALEANPSRSRERGPASGGWAATSRRDSFPSMPPGGAGSRMRPVLRWASSSTSLTTSSRPIAAGWRSSSTSAVAPRRWCRSSWATRLPHRRSFVPANTRLACGTGARSPCSCQRTWGRSPGTTAS